MTSKSSTTIDLDDLPEGELLPLVPPGEFLALDFMEPLGVTVEQLSAVTCISQQRLASIIKGRTRITPAIAVRLGRYFKIEPTFWLNIQLDYDIRREERRSGERIRRIIPVIPRTLPADE